MPSLIVPLTICAIALLAQRLGSGTARSTTGEPLEHVWVQELGAWSGALTTADGVFAFTLGKPATLLLSKDGFRPEIRLTAGTEKQGELTVVMQPAPDASLKLPSCERQGAGPLRELKLGTTGKLHVKSGGGADFVGYSATYAKNRATAAVLSSMTGIHVAGLTPTPDWVRGLSSFTLRTIECGGVQWTDLRGVSETGLQSRWVGYSLSHLEYSKVSPEAARAFDSAIDNGCCR
jgi:hypothetical protein